MTNWYASRVILESLKDANQEKEPAEAYLLKGAEALIPMLEKWVDDRESVHQEPTFAMFGKALTSLKKEYNRQMKLVERRFKSPDDSADEATYFDKEFSSPKHSPIKLKIKREW